MGIKRAAIVGVNTYVDPRIARLSGAVNDAKEVHTALTTYGDFEISPGHFLCDGDATADAIRTALSDLLWRTEEAEIVLLYFSGHGFEDEFGQGYLAPYDMDYERPLVRGIRMQEVNQLMNLAANKDVVLLILDACRSGIAASGDKGSERPQPGALEDAFSLSDEQDSGARGRIVLASSGPDENSRERTNCQHQLGPDVGPHAHGAFTFQLLEGMNGAAAGDDEIVTLLALHSYIDGQLAAERSQTLTFFGAGLQKFGNLGLVRASQHARISDILRRAEADLNSRDVGEFFQALNWIIDIYDKTSNHPVVKKLVSEIDTRLEQQRPKVSFYMLQNKQTLYSAGPQSYSQIQRLVSEISFEALLRCDVPLRNLLWEFWTVTYSGRTGWLADNYLPQQLAAYEQQAAPKRVE